MRRLAWLGRPWFLGAVALLALNDHVLKQAWPGWVTGKLSDFAGLVVVGTMAAVVAGPGWGAVLAGAGFVALKVVPGVAETLSPLLGGVGLRDASDLIALVVLPVLWKVLARPGTARSRRGWQVLGLVTAVLATTATSQAGPRTQDELDSIGWSRDGSFYATVYSADDKEDHYLRSIDGGMTWKLSGPPSGGVYSAEWTASDDVARAAGEAYRQCADDGVCVRVVHRDLDRRPRRETYLTYVQRRLAGGEWVLEALFDEDDPSVGRPAMNLSNSEQVVIDSGGGTVLVRTGYGDYRQVDVLACFHEPR